MPCVPWVVLHLQLEMWLTSMYHCTSWLFVLLPCRFRLVWFVAVGVLSWVSLQKYFDQKWVGEMPKCNSSGVYPVVYVVKYCWLPECSLHNFVVCCSMCLDNDLFLGSFSLPDCYVLFLQSADPLVAGKLCPMTTLDLQGLSIFGTVII